MEIPLLRDIVIIFGLSIAVLFVWHRFQVPAIVGWSLEEALKAVVTGGIIGPTEIRPGGQE
jgi:CPA2 family monovalent cation:H+ antiporter-2